MEQPATRDNEPHGLAVTPQSHPVAEPLLNRAQVADELGVSAWVVYSLIRRGKLPAIGILGRGWWRASGARTSRRTSNRLARAATLRVRYPISAAALL
jgi:hypothetical protein